MNAGKTWTEEELTYLEDSWGKYSVKGIANKLGRSIYSVKLKAQRIGLGDARFNFGGITVNQLSFALDTSYSILKNWIKVHDFPAKNKLFAEERKVLVVTYQDFWKWAEKHKQLLNFARLEENLIGPEPEWAKEKRKAELSGRKKKLKYCWI